MANISKKQFRVIIERDDEGMFIASVPVLPGCHTQAKNYETAVKRIREAIELYVEVLKDKKQLKFVPLSKSNFFAIEDLAIEI